VRNDRRFIAASHGPSAAPLRAGRRAQPALSQAIPSQDCQATTYPAVQSVPKKDSGTPHAV